MWYQLTIDTLGSPAVYRLKPCDTQNVLDATGANGVGAGIPVQLASVAPPESGADIDQIWILAPGPGNQQGLGSPYMIQDGYGHDSNPSVMLALDPESEVVKTVEIGSPGDASYWWIPTQDGMSGVTVFHLQDDPENRVLTVDSLQPGAQATVQAYTGQPQQNFYVEVVYGTAIWGPDSPYQENLATWRASAPSPANGLTILQTLQTIQASLAGQSYPETLPGKLDFWLLYYDGTTGNAQGGANGNVGKAWVDSASGDWVKVDEDLDPTPDYTSDGPR